ncbi:tetratricopeptide repeat protein [Nakamurella sp.]|uniref:tetratricopeptide repeat protein n=1 Tax=Nakamurella sp. TaxID=1869182 RepID=UPI003B3AA1E3
MAAGTLADDDPDTAWWHARAARARGGRIAVVRETVGLVAYRAGEWAEAIGELRAARRMGGGPGHLAVLADCERALGHPEKAIELSRSEQATELDADARVELATVVAGARADLGQTEAGLAHLEQFDPQERARNPRLGYAYADLLDRAGRPAEALTWFIRAANADTDEDTDALERVEALAAVVGSATEEAADPATGEAGPDSETVAVTDADPGADSGEVTDATVAGLAAGTGAAAGPEAVQVGPAPAGAEPTSDDGPKPTPAIGPEPTSDNGPDGGPGDGTGTGDSDPGPAGAASEIPQVLFSDDGK